MAARLREMLDAKELCYFTGVVHAERTVEAVSLLTPENAASQEDVRNADLVAVLECNLLDEAPMMALAVRQAWRNGARIYIVGSECRSDLSPQQLYKAEYVNSLADIPLTEAQRPVVICGTRHNGLETIDAVARSGAKLAFILDGPNAFGCAMLSSEYSASSLSEAITSGKIKGVISFESDLPLEMLEGVRVLAAADWQATPVLSKAEIVLPTTAWVEMDGVFVNNEGRAQRFNQVMQPGLPIKGLDPALHPPRVHRNIPPGGDVLPAWRIIAAIIERLGGEKIEDPFSGRWERVRGLDADGEGLCIVHD